jgi:intein/homing endonuclease
MDNPRPATLTTREGYSSWAAIAGFFDGDGSVDLSARAYTLHWVLSFSDNWLGQIEQIREFLANHGINVKNSRRNGIGGWICEVKEISSMMAMAQEMLRSGGIYKKKRELQMLIDYYSDKVTGTEVLEAFNSEVRHGIRVGKIRYTEMPYTHSEGLARARYASSFEQKALNEIETQNLINDYLTKDVTGKSLAGKYDVSEATVSRILKRSSIDTKSRSKKPNSILPDSTETG